MSAAFVEAEGHIPGLWMGGRFSLGIVKKLLPCLRTAHGFSDMMNQLD